MKKINTLVRILIFVGMIYIIYIIPFTIFWSISVIKQLVDGFGKMFLSSPYFIQICVGQIIFLIKGVLLGLLIIGGAQILVLRKWKKSKDAIHGC
jgi:hypothetical protein